jgi:hypothetical protein
MFFQELYTCDITYVYLRHSRILAFRPGQFPRRLNVKPGTSVNEDVTLAEAYGVMRTFWCYCTDRER